MKTLSKLFFIVTFLGIGFSLSAQQIPKWKITDLQQFIKTTDSPTIVNFWASWCKPCVEELPYFLALQKKYDSTGLQLILVNLDLPQAYPQKISSFAAKHKVTAPIYFLDETNADVFCPVVDASWSGAIPATLFINNKTGYRKFYEDQLPKEKVEEEILKIVADKK